MVKQQQQQQKLNFDHKKFTNCLWITIQKKSNEVKTPKESGIYTAFAACFMKLAK